MKTSDLSKLPKHLIRWTGLFVREHGKIIEALPEDIKTAKSYPQFPDKGSLVDGKRITILTTKLIVQPSEIFRIIHVAEFVDPNFRVYIAGPKPIYGEYINEELVTEPPPIVDPLTPKEYAGVTLPSPAVDYNYDITSYGFDDPGEYRIQWRLHDLCSNILVVNVKPFET